MNVRFTSDEHTTTFGFRLDVQSTPCTGLENYLQQRKHDEHYEEVELSAGEVQYDALVTETDYYGNYPNDAYRNWNIITDENEV